jgi:multiple sugar transport system substrate-binding protein
VSRERGIALHPHQTGRRRSAIRQIPEGPYESGDPELGEPPSIRNMARLFDLLEQLHRQAERVLGLRGGQREMRGILALMRHHLAGRLVTRVSLAAASGLSYGTAMRMIDDMLGRGLIVTRPRTATGKSFSLHPSAELLSRWHRFAQHMEEAVQTAAQTAMDGSKPARPLPAPARVIPPPPVLETKLLLGRGLRLLLHADPTFMAMHALKKQFEMILGVGIHTRALSIDRLLAETMENSRLAASKYDIIACDFPWFGEMAATGRLLPLDALMAEAGVDVADFYHDALTTSRHAGRQFGIPVMATAEMLVYRTDLLAEAGISPPRTTDATIAAARRLHDPARGISGIAWNGGRGTPIGHSFIMVMSAFGRPVLNLRPEGDGFDTEYATGEQLRPLFASPGALATVQYLHELRHYSPPNILSMAWYDRAIAYAHGRAAMAYSHSLLAPLYEMTPASPAHRRTGYMPHPVGPRGRPIVPMGGYALAIPSNIAPERVRPAWVALRALTSAGAAKLYLLNGSLASPRLSVSRDPEVQALSPLIATVDAMAARGYVRMWPRPPVPGMTEVIAIAGEEVHDALSGAKSLKRALADAQNRADAVMRARGYY